MSRRSRNPILLGQPPSNLTTTSKRTRPPAHKATPPPQPEAPAPAPAPSPPQYADAGQGRGELKLPQLAAYRPARGKRIHVYRNGDRHHPGRNFVVHQGTELGTVLDRLTQGLNATLGVCRLYTPETGTRVGSVRELRNGGQYVAAAHEPFKPLPTPYTAIEDPALRQRANWQRAKTHINIPLPRPGRVVVKSGRARKLASQRDSKTVWLIRNGDMISRPLKLVLSGRNALTWEQVLQCFSDRLRPDGGSARRVYDFAGHRVKTLDGFADGGRYVVVGLGQLKRLDYEHGRASPDGSKAPRRQAKARRRPREPPLPPRSKAIRYNVTIDTRPGTRSGTSAGVFLTLIGSAGTSDRLPMRKDAGSFQANSSELMVVTVPPIGEIRRICLEHDDSGKASAWHVGKVCVRDVGTNQKSYFAVNRWLDAGRGNSKTAVEVDAMSAMDQMDNGVTVPRVLSPEPTLVI